MVDFAGWRMPIQYRGTLEEHRAVRQAAGLFDVSHMGEARVRGPQAIDYLQWITCNDISKPKPGRAQYNALTTPEGGFVDDLLIYKIAADDLLLVINAGNTPKDLAWLQEQAGRFDVEVTDESADWCQLALQGPKAVSILERCTDVELAKLRYYSFRRGDVAGASCIVSRTGYTGEDGFEVYGPADAAVGLWNAVMEAGAADGLQPVGLGARDTLRLEAKMALYGNDIDESTTVLEADLGWIVKLAKGDFIGRDVLARQAEEGVQKRLAGFELGGRRIARHDYPAVHDGKVVGRVTSGTFAPTLEKSIGLCYLPVELTEPGTRFEVDCRGRAEPATVVPTPFYKRDA
ncbi:glycine cleavage system protein T [Acidobacteria bacterium Mor1]|nr:glycine cleavage system protein T [Acidobacteria bacterium Mor1]